MVARIVTQEDEKHKQLENLGGDALKEKLGGKNAGMPFMAVVSPSGQMVINSNELAEQNSGNIGYPAKPNEIAHFMRMLRTSESKLTEADLTKIETWLREHAPKG